MAGAQLLKGQAIAENYLDSAARQIRQIKAEQGELALAAIQVGRAKDTVLYSSYLGRTLKKMGIRWAPNLFPENESESAVIEKIRKLNDSPRITGILVFSPLPGRLSPTNVLSNIHILKDVEGRTFLKSHFGVFSPTANAVLALIESKMPNLAGKKAVVVGHGDLVGKPTAILLMDRLATVTVCHARTKNIESHISQADIVVAVVGKPNIIKGKWIKKGAMVIDVGENRVAGKLVGDIEFEPARARASYLSPVPGGVGPVTNVMLIKN